MLKSRVFSAVMVSAFIASLAMAAAISNNFYYKSYTEAKMAPSHLTYAMVHRKLGIGSTFVGVVKNFTVSGNLDNTKNEFHNGVIAFKVADMDSDNASRDKEMRSKYINPQIDPSITIKFLKSLKLGSQTVPASISLLGASYPISISTNIIQNGTNYSAIGQSVLSLKALGITPPQMLGGVISVDDKVVVNYQVSVPK